MASNAFQGFDITGFWDDSTYALENYVEDFPSDELIHSIETELGYKLPASYVALMKTHNGGIPTNNRFPTAEPTSWADDHVAINGICGIGRTRPHSLCGELGSQFMQEEWGYPAIGICICDCPSAGHDLIMLDYSACGKNGEPTVVHVDQEADNQITFLAKDFESFICRLVAEEEFDTSEQDAKDDLERIMHGSFSPLLTSLIQQETDLDYEKAIRTIGRQLLAEKGYFAFHADALSTLLYDIQFLLYSASNPGVSQVDYLAVYPEIIAIGDGEFSTGGYAPGFVEDWLDDRLKANQLLKQPSGGLIFDAQHIAKLKQDIRQYA